jgi:glutamate synthase domain-containing protein 1
MKHTNDSTFPLYNAHWEHDACGMGFLAQISGEPNHYIVKTALEALTRLTHRGAQDADAETSDGAGLLTQIPRELFSEEVRSLGITLNDPEDIAAGMLFLPSQERFPEENTQSRLIIEQVLREVDLVRIDGNDIIWRNPPIDNAILGERARETAPNIVQILLLRSNQLSLKMYERSLYHARRLIEKRLQRAGIKGAYIVSLSRSTIIYKGLLAPNELNRFYLDLADSRYKSAFAIFHQRYSTNTFPSWALAQPFRMLAHNGEINTIQGNRNWLQAREASLDSRYWHQDFQDLLPIIQVEGSDSAQLDNML